MLKIFTYELSFDLQFWLLLFFQLLMNNMFASYEMVTQLKSPGLQALLNSGQYLNARNCQKDWVP